jgi:hypothetical protein
MVRRLWLEVVRRAARTADGARRALAIMHTANELAGARGGAGGSSSFSASSSLLDGEPSSGTLGLSAGAIGTGGVLGIEDLLPLLPPNTAIGDFKEEVKKAVDSCQRGIRDLQNKMADLSNAADQTRADARRLRERHVKVAPGAVCMFCGAALVSRPFYLFPTGFGYHCVCLITEVYRSMSRSDRFKVDSALEELAASEHEVARLRALVTRSAADRSGDKAALAKLEEELAATLDAAFEDEARARHELDMLVAKEDPLCGEYIIEKIDKDFPAPTPEADGIEDWSI